MNNKDSIEIFVKKVLKKFNIKIEESLIKLLVQIFKFIIVGGIATIIDFIVFYILTEYVLIKPLIANIFAFGVSVIYNYNASVKWIFSVNKDKSKKRLFIEFMVFSIIGLVLTELLLALFIKVLLLSNIVSKLIATIVTMIFNFITRKLFLE